MLYLRLLNKEWQMKFSITNEQLSFFHQEGAIEFEGLLNTNEAASLYRSVQEGIAIRLSLSPLEVGRLRPDELYIVGRDLWRSNDEIRKIISHRRFGEMASQLINTKLLRLGYDQYFPGPKPITSLDKVYQQLLSPGKTLHSYGSIQGVLCGLMLCIAGTKSPSNSSNLKIFSSVSGNGVFFIPSLSIDLTDLFNHMGQDYYLIVYANAKSVYTLNREDAHSRDWISLGYDFGDKLSDKLHPIIYR
jgi:hypothetical protein